MKFIGPVTIAVLVVFANQASCSPQVRIVLDNIFKDYDKGIRPNYGREPVTVGITAYFLALANVNEKDMSFTTTLYFREIWKDTRLAFPPLTLEGTNTKIDKIELYGDHKDMIWEPDTFIPNEITSVRHQLGVPNVFVRLSSDGTILKSSRYTITASCPMDLSYYPFDYQICNLEIESYAFSANDLVYKWDKGQNASVGMGDLSHPDFRVSGHMLKTQAQTFASGNYSRLVMDIHLARASGRFINRFFFPMTLFVAISLLSLWILSPKIGAFINFLNIGFINLFMAEGAPDLPSISYRTSLDVFFGICIFHVVLALGDSLLASFFEISSERKHEVIEMSSRRRLSEDAENLCSNQPQLAMSGRLSSFNFNLINIFIKSGIVLLFLLCNMVFWICYKNAAYPTEYFDDFIPKE